MMIRQAVCCVLFLISTCAFAWQHETSLGFGYGQELNRSYNNLGFMADYIYYNRLLDPKLRFLTDISAAYWHADTASHQSLVTLATSLGFRAYFVNPSRSKYRPFIQIFIGPSYLSNKTFGTKTQGMTFAFQDRFGAGLEIGHGRGGVVMTVQFIHYSNADLKKPNPGFNIPIVGSIGYQI